MKRSVGIYAIMIGCFIAAIFFTACSKTVTEPANTTPGIINYAIYGVDSTIQGRVSVTEAAGGEASVDIKMDKAFVDANGGNLQPLLQNSEPLAQLTPVNVETGISHTSPVFSLNKSLTISYDALMRTRDLQLMMVNADKRVVASSKLR